MSLLSGSESPDLDRMRFLPAQFAFWLMAATDGHAKNFSVFLRRGDAYALTPLYDVISAWPVFGNGPNSISPRKAGLSMALHSKNVHYRLFEILTRHWKGLAKKSGVPQVWNEVLAMVERVESALAAIGSRLPAEFPDRVWTGVSERMKAQVRDFRGGLSK